MTHPDLQELQHAIAERVHPPEFAEVLSRASGARRRRRTTIGAGLAASLVVVGLAVAVGDPGGTGRRSGEPAEPSVPWDGTSEVDSRLPADVRDVLSREPIYQWYVSASGGAVAALWRSCEPGGECEFALVTGLGDDVRGLVLPGTAAPPTIAPVPGGWLVEDDNGPRRLTVDGDLEPVHTGDTDDPVGVEPGDTAVQTRQGVQLLRGDLLVPVPSIGRRGQDAYLTDAGRLVLTTTGEHSAAVSVTTDGRSWETSPLESGAMRVATASVAGHGDHVSVAVLGDDPDGSLAVLSVQVSHDAGRTWLLARTPDDLRNLSGMTVSPEGTTYLTTGSHGLVRVDVDGMTTAEQLSSHDMTVFADGEQVCLVVEGGLIDHLQCSADDGRTWEPAPLPGFR